MNIHSMFEMLVLFLTEYELFKVKHHSLTINISLSDSACSTTTFSLTGDIGSPFLDVLSFGLSLKHT